MRVFLRRFTLITLSLAMLLAGTACPLHALAQDQATATADEYQTIDGVAYRTLQRGMEGEDVLRLKQRMQELGFFVPEAILTNSYNSTMEYKVKQYQNALGVKATGVATPQLQAAMFAEGGGLPTPAPTPTFETVLIDGVAYRTLRRNDSGDDVLRLKQRLQQLGFFNADAELTDSYNSTMEYKVKQYQNALGEKATGIATPQLQALAYTDGAGLPTASQAGAPATTPAPPGTTPAPQGIVATATPAPTPFATLTPAESATETPVMIDGQPYRTLKRDMTGEDVLRLKQRLQALGFFYADAALSDSYNSTMVDKVKQYQRAVGQKATGIASPQLQALAYSDGGGLPIATPAPTPVTVTINGVAYRTLKRTMTGEDVQRLKVRLVELGYFPQNTEITDQFNNTMEYKIKQYQNDLGVKATGIATPELQATLFGDYGGLPTPVPPSLPSLPPLTADGYLPTAGDAYVYANEESGLWLYISDTLHVQITRYTRQGNNPLIWFETDIRFTQAEAFKRFDATQKYEGHFNTEYPQAIAANNNLVLAFNDDFYGIRKHRKQRQGVIIRDGTLIANDPYSKNVVVYMPPLDLLAFFKDGSARALYGNEYTADALLEMGVTDTLSFGPVLLRGGELGQQVADGKFASNEPRCALGMVAPRHYLLITVEGRHSKSKGTGLNWIAKRMQELGVTEAVNLDGGNTTALVFQGQLLNKIGTLNGKMVVLRGVRSVSSIMGIGRNSPPISPAQEE